MGAIGLQKKVGAIGFQKKGARVSLYTTDLSLGYLTRSGTNQAVQPQKMVSGLKFWI